MQKALPYAQGEEALNNANFETLSNSMIPNPKTNPQMLLLPGLLG